MRLFMRFFVRPRAPGQVKAAVRQSANHVGNQVKGVGDAACHKQRRGVFPKQPAAEHAGGAQHGPSDSKSWSDQVKHGVQVGHEGKAAKQVIKVAHHEVGQPQPNP